MSGEMIYDHAFMPKAPYRTYLLLVLEILTMHLNVGGFKNAISYSYIGNRILRVP